MSLLIRKIFFIFLNFKIVFNFNVDIFKVLKSNESNNEIYKVISYDITKDYIKENVSLKTKIAQDFYNSLTQIEHKKTFLETILNENENDNQYEIFENIIFLI